MNAAAVQQHLAIGRRDLTGQQRATMDQVRSVGQGDIPRLTAAGATITRLASAEIAPRLASA